MVENIPKGPQFRVRENKETKQEDIIFYVKAISPINIATVKYWGKVD